MDQAERLRNMIKASKRADDFQVARLITVTSGKGGVGKSNTARSEEHTSELQSR